MPNEKGPNEKKSSPTKNWTPAVPAKHADNIISSDYAGTKKVFIPSYERECRPCMNQLIANEYQRIWWEERDAWAKSHPDKSAKKKAHRKSEKHSRKTAKEKSSKSHGKREKVKKAKEVVSGKEEKDSDSLKKTEE